MENISGNLAKDVIDFFLPGIKKRKRHWNILFVDDRGKIVSFKRIRHMAIACGLALVIAVVVTCCLFFIGRSSRTENRELKESLALLRKEVKELRHERDLRMVDIRNVIDTLDKPVIKAGPKKEVKKAVEKSDVKPKETTPSLSTEKTLDSIAGTPPISVGVEDFSVSHGPENNILRVRFLIKNLSKTPGKISGRIFVVLKPDNNKQDRWLIIPPVNLTSGKPSDIKKGHFFKIARYKTVELLATNQTAPERFTTATVFVFTTKGELVLEKDIPVSIEKPKQISLKKKSVPKDITSDTNKSQPNEDKMPKDAQTGITSTEPDGKSPDKMQSTIGPAQNLSEEQAIAKPQPDAVSIQPGTVQNKIKPATTPAE
jgi:hypothetical protein